MRKNSVRHFIHAVIDVLPLLVIPIFALNILHKETEPISIEVQEKISINFNQLYNYQLTQNAINNNVELTNLDNGYLTFTGTYTSSPLFGIVSSQNTFNVNQNHKFYIRGVTNTYGWAIQIKSNIPSEDTYSKWVLQDSIFEYPLTNMRLNFRNYNGPTNNTIDFNTAFQIYDLTLMFGSGNEPTKEQFDLMFPNSYYEYTESQKMLINKPTPTTFNSTDIGSQFVYAMYKPVHDYFNFNNLFNMQGIYDWIQLNLFNGTAPLPVFIIWNIIVYEFFVDLLFLFYAVFMFVIDFAEKCLDRPFRRM